MKISFMLILCCAINLLHAQPLQGVYTFHRQEMVASFRFNADNTFDFFYSYGASDRTATGTFTTIGDTVKLKSKKVAGNDFEILSQSKKGKAFKIKVTDKNPYLVSNVAAIVLNGGDMQYFETNNEGIITIDLKSCDTIYIKHELFPDIPTLIKDVNNSNNYFELALKPSLGEVSFKGIDLFIKDNSLTCYPNYFIPFENIRFEKE